MRKQECLPSKRKMSNEIKSKQGWQGALYHGTSLANGESIWKTGFRPSGSGKLGSGVYLANFQKACRFARDAQGRGLGAGCAVIRVRVSIQNAKYIEGDDTLGKWQKEGYDAVRTDKTTASFHPEWCIANSSQVEITGIKRGIPNNDLDFECKSGDPEYTPTSGPLSLPDDDAVSSPPNWSQSGPTIQDLVIHKLFCEQGCSKCVKWKYEKGKILQT